MDAQAREHACPQAVALLMAASAIAVTAAARGLTSPAEGPVGSSEPAPTRVAASLSVAALNDSPLARPRSRDAPSGCVRRALHTFLWSDSAVRIRGPDRDRGRVDRARHDGPRRRPRARLALALCAALAVVSASASLVRHAGVSVRGLQPYREEPS